MKQSISGYLLGAGLLLTTIGWVSCNGGSETKDTPPKDTTVIDDSTKPAASDADAKATALATLTGTKTDTSLNGTAKFTEVEGGKVRMELELTVPTKANKSVAVHFHAMADCGDMGNMTGGHWNPTNKMHGKWGSDNFHSGDIGNINLDGSGKGKVDIESNLWTIGGDSTTNILDRSIIVHSGVDDYKSQPAGNSGSRIGCGLIKKQ